MEVDQELSAFLGLDENPVFADLEGGSDAMDTFYENAKLAAALGQNGWTHAEKLAATTAKRAAPAPAVSDDRSLAKMEGALDRKKRNYAIWMKSQYALGKSAHELISFAERHDPATARLLAEVAAELDAA